MSQSEVFKLKICDGVEVPLPTVQDAILYLKSVTESLEPWTRHSANVQSRVTLAIGKLTKLLGQYPNPTTPIDDSFPHIDHFNRLPLRLFPGHPDRDFVDSLSDLSPLTKCAAAAYVVGIEADNIASPAVFEGCLRGFAYLANIGPASSFFKPVMQSTIGDAKKAVAEANALLASVHEKTAEMTSLSHEARTSFTDNVQKMSINVEGLAQQVRDLVAGAHREVDHVKAHTRREFAELRQRKGRQATRLVRFAVSAQRKWTEDRKSEFVKRLADLEEAYSRALATRAAREYWERRARVHKVSALRFVRHVKKAICYTVIALAVLTLAAVVLAACGIALGDHIELAVLGVSLIVLAFWVIRTLARQYFAESHLARDASERATMIKTYVALVKDGQASQSDEALKYFLTPIFRPGSDGYIKGDHGPNHPLFEVVQKLRSEREK